MTEFNNICRKPHWPREPQIRYLLKALDVTLPPNKRGNEGGDDGDDYSSEGETSYTDCLTDEECPNDNLHEAPKPRKPIPGQLQEVPGSSTAKLTREIPMIHSYSSCLISIA